MALKFSEMAAQRVDLARNLEAGFDNYRETIAGGYSEFVTSLLADGETLPDPGLQLDLLKRGVVRSRERLQNLNSGVVEQINEEERVRADLDLRVEGLDGKLRRVRHVCRGFYGDEGVARAGLKKEPPRAASRLHEHGTTVKASLENPALGLKPLIAIETGDGVSGPHVQLAAQLEPELSELGELVGGRHQENRKSADVRSQRRRVIHEFDRDVRAIVRTAQGLFRIAGRDDLAERFRPILRKIGRRADKAKTEAAAEKAAEASEANGESATPAAETAASEETTA